MGGKSGKLARKASSRDDMYDFGRGRVQANSDSGRCIIVDSTKRKYMSDALSKTVPIWCEVMNRLLFPRAADHCGLVTPREAVLESEHEEIAKRLDKFVEQAKVRPSVLL